MSNSKSPSVIFTGFALFSMFFGAGNIIFPLVLGRLSGSETPIAVLGLGLSAVCFPFLGLIAMMLYGGNLTLFLSRFGKWPAFFLLFVLQMSQGSLGAMPRLVTLMHASMKSFFPDFSLFVFSILICALVFFLTIKPQKIIDLLGSVLTPLLLLSLGVLVTVGIFWAPIVPLGSEGSGHYFQQGIFLGYQTMDLSAALLFATMVLPHLSGGTNDPKVVRRRMIQASLIASGLLMAVYVGLAWIAARHCGDFGQVSPEDLLQSISVKILGPFGGIVSSVAVFLACFTTAISLASVFAGYVRQELFKNRFGNGVSLCITLGFTALIANMGFRGIIGLWGPLLTVLYPLLIAICIYNIAKAPKNKSQFLHSP